MADKELFPLALEKPKEKDIKAILSKYLRFWYWFVLGVVICVSVAYIYLKFAVPQYYISSKLLIRDPKNESSFSGGEGFVSLDVFTTTKNIDNEVEMLKSKSLMLRVLKELSFNISYYTKGTFGIREMYGEVIPIKVVVSGLDSAAFEKSILIHFDGNNHFKLEEDEKITRHQFGQQIKKPYGVFTIVANSNSVKSGQQQPVIIKFHDMKDLANGYAGKLKIVQENKSASVLTLSLVDAVPDKGKDILDKLVEVYDKEAVEDKNRIASSTLNFIDERLAYLTTELTDVEKDVEQYKSRNSVTDVTSQVSLYLQEASQYNKQLAEIGVQIAVLESIEKYLNKQGSQYQLVPSSLTIDDPTLQTLINRFNELQLDRERLLRTTQLDNPLIQNMSEQLLNLRVNILENLQNIKNSLAISHKNLEAKSLQFGSRIKQVPAIERELQEIGRQQGIKEALYLYLLQKREESALSLASATSKSLIIDPAEAIRFPVSPKRSTIYLISFLLGITIPFSGIFIRDFLNNRVQQLSDVEGGTLTPILGEISHNGSRKVMVVTDKQHSPVAELFRLVRANLQFTAVGKDSRVFLVTSSMSGEGKTFVSINLGASLALTGKKVVVLSFDLRKPKLMHDLGLPYDVGVTNFLINKNTSLHELLIPSPEVQNLFLIGSGPLPPNPTELMMSERAISLINELKNCFDYILIDSAPVGQVSDAFSLAPLVDSCLFIVRYGYTYKEQLGVVDNIYRNKKINAPMIILNDAKGNNGYGYGYGYGTGYGYGDKKDKFKVAILN